MVKKSTVIFTIVAMLAFGACTCWGYTVSQWPVPGIPNTVFCPGPPCLVTPEDCMLKGPVAPSCECPLVPGAIHAAISIPYRAIALVASPCLQASSVLAKDAAAWILVHLHMLPLLCHAPQSMHTCPPGVGNGYRNNHEKGRVNYPAFFASI